MRIISGKFKGKKLIQPTDKLTRPLKDIAKESIFNLLAHSELLKIDISISKILDIFSGSGSFGLECISRGSNYVIFCENYKPAIQILEKNIKLLSCEDFTNIIKKSFFEILKINNFFKFNFNLIFLDPPFKEKKISELLKNIQKANILEKNGLIILHRNKKDQLVEENFYKIVLKRLYGQSQIYFIKLTIP